MQFTLNKENKKALSILLCCFIMIGIFAVVIAKADEASKNPAYNNTFLEGGYSHPSKFDDYEKMFVVDVYSGKGTVDWAKVKEAGFDGAMIRIGYTRWAAGTINADTAFETNYKGAKEAGLKVGVYYFSQAVDAASALKEADLVLSSLEGKTLDLPVAMDLEYGESSTGGFEGILYEAELSKEVFTSNINTFCDYIKANGFDAMVYLNKLVYNTHLDAASLKYPVWLARYASSVENADDFSFVMWQYTNKASINGISGNADASVLYLKNGSIVVPTTSVTTTTETETTTVQSESTTVQSETTTLSETTVLSESTTVSEGKTVVPDDTTSPAESSTSAEPEPTSPVDIEDSSFLSLIFDVFKAFISFMKKFVTLIISLFN